MTLIYCPDFFIQRVIYFNVERMVGFFFGDSFGNFFWSGRFKYWKCLFFFSNIFVELYTLTEKLHWCRIGIVIPSVQNSLKLETYQQDRNGQCWQTKLKLAKYAFWEVNFMFYLFRVCIWGSVIRLTLRKFVFTELSTT